MHPNLLTGRPDMLLHAYAKINWALDTVGLRDDGYHLLDTIMQSVSLHDDIAIEPDSKLSLSVIDAPHVPSDESNLILHAAEALCRNTETAFGAHITLRKRIPVGAGLGGGSTDAAVVLRALNDMWDLKLSEETLYKIGLSLGADIPFCLHGGICRAQGIGEVLTPFESKKQYHLILIQPCRGLSTKQVFDELSKETTTQHPDIECAIRALQTSDLTLLAASIGNTLQNVSEKLRPEIRQAINALREHGARIAQMTGSGSAVFGVFPSMRAADTAWNSLNRRFPICIQTHTLCK